MHGRHTMHMQDTPCTGTPCTMHGGHTLCTGHTMHGGHTLCTGHTMHETHYARHTTYGTHHTHARRTTHGTHHVLQHRYHATGVEPTLVLLDFGHVSLPVDGRLSGAHAMFLLV